MVKLTTRCRSQETRLCNARFCLRRTWWHTRCHMVSQASPLSSDIIRCSPAIAMPRTRRRSGIVQFGRPRLLDYDRHREQVPGRYPVSVWRNPKATLRKRVSDAIFPKKKQSPSSSAGFGKLPNEVLNAIFYGLCGREIHSIRLVSSEWEVASRPFFAARHLSRSVFWLTSSNLDMLDSLSRKFGPYMHNLFIAADHFAISGLVRAWKQYMKYQYSHVVARHYDLEKNERHRCSKSVLEIKSHYLGQWFKHQEWRTYCDMSQSGRFFQELRLVHYFAALATMAKEGCQKAYDSIGQTTAVRSQGCEFELRTGAAGYQCPCLWEACACSCF